MDNDYQVFDVIDSMKIPDLQVTQNSIHHVYIPKLLYDRQLMCGQETDSKTRRQLKIDAPRCYLTMDGSRVVTCPQSMSTDIARYCTQCVMAFPVELMSKFGIVSENRSPSPLCIDVWGECVFVEKKLSIIIPTDTDLRQIPVHVSIQADMNDSCVVMCLKTGSTFMTNSLPEN